MNYEKIFGKIAEACEKIIKICKGKCEDEICKNEQMEKIFKAIYDLLFELRANESSYDLEFEKIVPNKSITIEETENGYRFILPYLLESKIYGASYQSSKKYSRYVYTEAFEKYDLEKGFKHISGKVDLIYINHFTKKSIMIDNDNVDTKMFTDCISNYILCEDNPLRCNLHISGIVDNACERSFTEVIIRKIEE